MAEAASTPIHVIDTHIHLADGWQDWKEGGKGMKNTWLPCEGPSFQRNWTEADLVALHADAGTTFQTDGYIFVECSNEPFLEEAKWTLAMVDSPDSKVMGVVAHIPVPDGRAAVEEFLAGLKEADGSFPPGLKGGRVVLLGNPMPAPDACLAPKYLEGLEALSETGLLWEWCCLSESIPSITEACKKFPAMTFVLDHLGHNSSGEDFATWGPAITELAKCENVVAKLGAIEQWDVADPAPFLDHALTSFGPARVLAESNWFVNTAMGDAYDSTFKTVLAACKRAGYSAAEQNQVFVGNAKRVYSL